ncbi:MAG: threonine synthase [Candidatus Micrarchaeota archaeon]|nr:threonine synthase [Candidatus Micrarchaeota archaeon]
MYEIGYRCMDCNVQVMGTKPEFKCMKCGGSLEVDYDYEKMKSAFVPMQFRYMPPTHMKYYFALPLARPHNAITMGEGGTPLISLGGNVLAKLEGVNPTGAFKDRGSAVEISKAVELGRKEVVCASTGNMGASIAAYAAKAGVKAVIFTPEFAEPVKLKQMKYYGAKIIRGGKTYTEAMLKSIEYAKNSGAYLTGDYPYRLEGQKTVAYEIADQLNFDIPDNIIIPVGNGTLFYATFKAFNEMVHLGIVRKVPRLIAVQAAGCAPIVSAFRKKAHKITPVKTPKTIASAINCDAPVDGAGVLKALYSTKGEAVAVSDQESVRAKLELAHKGVYAEVSSAAAYAGYLKLRPGGKSVIILTGIGFKDKY